MKNIKSFLAIILSLIFIFSSSISVLALAGDGNVDGGGGDLGGGSSSSYWNAGWDGLRVSVYKSKPQNGKWIKVGRSFDVSNLKEM